MAVLEESAVARVASSGIQTIVWCDGNGVDKDRIREVVRERWDRRAGFVPEVLVTDTLPDLDPADGDDDTVMVVPLHLEFSLFHREHLAEWAARTRRLGYEVTFDEPDASESWVVNELVERATRLMGERDLTPGQTGLILLADGRGDARTRAGSYQLMRLLWEHLGVAEAEVVFEHHGDRQFSEMLPRLTATPIDWLVVPQTLCQEQPGSSVANNEAFHVCETSGYGDALLAWVDQRINRLWNQRRTRENRVRSARGTRAAESTLFGPDLEIPIRELSRELPVDAQYGGDTVLATTEDANALRHLLEAYGVDGAGPTFVKVTWHGYATGTYTDPVALDRLLTALPGKAVLLEGHTISKNRSEGVDWDWESECVAHRDWISNEERVYRESTGLQEVIDRHGATILNVTEAAWDGQCASRDRVLDVLETRGVTPTVPELCDAIPAVMLDHLDRPLISFARFKGPTRMSISNCFGLLPGPYRGAWHGPDVTYFSRVCSEIGRIYGALFDTYGLNEAFNVAVRWNREGLYRSRWGHYDLTSGGNTMTLSRGLAGADLIACRLQGQDPRRSAFYDQASEILDVDRSRYLDPISPRLIRRFV